MKQSIDEQIQKALFLLDSSKLEGSSFLATVDSVTQGEYSTYSISLVRGDHSIPVGSFYVNSEGIILTLASTGSEMPMMSVRELVFTVELEISYLIREHQHDFSVLEELTFKGGAL